MAERLSPGARGEYERPGLPYRCGRAGTWNRPCWQGPDLAGRCGGETECAPVKTGERWACRRPAAAGGPCAEGPLPDGRCAHARPACLPRRSLRRVRGRLSLIASLLVVALIASFADFSPSPRAGMSALDPGPLASVHAGFTGQTGCAACHAEHDLAPVQWLGAAFTGHDQASRCLTCHRFAGDERAAHNRSFPDRPEIPQPACATCHTEHRGGGHDIARVKDALCANCHQPKVSRFSGDHPVFPPAFPYEIPNNINFDHNAHLNAYFEPGSRYVKQANRDPALARRAKAACTTCHVVESASREVTPRKFEAICAGCHLYEILERPLVLLMPEEPTPIMTVLLGLAVDGDEDEALERSHEFLERAAAEGLDAIGRRISGLGDAAAPGRLLEGLASPLVKAAAAAWKEEDGEYEAPQRSDLQTGGWAAGEDADGNQSLRYTPRRHADPVMVAWVRYLRALGESADQARRSAARTALESLLDPDEGAGACGKCHQAGLTRPEGRNTDTRGRDPAQRLAARWDFTGPAQRRYTTYAHRPHIDILGPDRSCLTCHRMNRDARYAEYFSSPGQDPQRYASNFHAIDKKTCERCHTEGRVTTGCQTCHRYHRQAGFKREFQALDPRFNIHTSS